MEQKVRENKVKFKDEESNNTLKVDIPTLRSFKDEKKDYYQEFIHQYKEIRKNHDTKPKLLLHVCCGPCSCYPLIFLNDLFDITILYSNSNIYPRYEYEKRLYYLKKFVSDINYRLKSNIKIVEDKYNYQEFRESLLPFKSDKEMVGTRCKVCITKRMTSLFEYAKDNDFKYVTTVMSYSRNKDAQFINFIGKVLGEKYKDDNITFIFSDFKKNNGQEIGINIAKKNNLYRQEYCGCEFSLEQSKILNRKVYDVTVVVAIHNVYQYLSKCLESLKNQDFKGSYEVIMVLDSATKDDKEIARKYLELNPTIFKYHEVNFKDLSEVRNYGIKVSYSKYLAFIDGDDYVETNYISRFFSVMEETKSDIVICNHYLDFGEKVKKYYQIPIKIKGDKTSTKLCKELSNDVRVRGYVWNKFYKREIIENNNVVFPSFKASMEDGFFNFVYMTHVKKVTFIKDRLYHYVQREGSVVHTNYMSVALKMINMLFLCKYYSIRNNIKETTKGLYIVREFVLLIMGIQGKKTLEIPLREYFKMIHHQMTKIRFNRFTYEGEEWEKAIYLYIEKVNSNYFGNK